MKTNNIPKNKVIEEKEDTLYFDGQCPLCAKEIAWLKQCQYGKLRFSDIHGEKLGPLPFNKDEMLKKLHLRCHNGGWLTGLDATVRSWSHTPYGFIMKPLRWPFIRTIADIAYAHWAKQRYKKRYECSKCSMRS